MAQVQMKGTTKILLFPPLEKGEERRRPSIVVGWTDAGSPTNFCITKIDIPKVCPKGEGYLPESRLMSGFASFSPTCKLMRGEIQDECD